MVKAEKARDRGRGPEPRFLLCSRFAGRNEIFTSLLRSGGTAYLQRGTAFGHWWDMSVRIRSTLQRPCSFLSDGGVSRGQETDRPGDPSAHLGYRLARGG
ncbi:hypothetical protein GCM10023193_79710 [Planotetraspora kaengkrachanensis]|uniref:Uncharacterized protein n=1 Tax=Planotetraspora kaengkrachanensis TaxID=575193 RepID=A0A8J3M523_9ACTN|nr:hypothetical protein Pka01_25320 [Planotetraspora kaengkrachanensis]